MRYKNALILLTALFMALVFCQPAGATALSADKSEIIYTEGETLDIPVAASTTIYLGAMVSVNSSGYAIPAADTASTIFQGIATARADNSSGSNGDISVRVMRDGLFKMASAATLTQANVGDAIYVADDQTVNTAAALTNDIYCGVIVKFLSSSSCWIDIQPAVQQADVATHLADTSAAHAASAISIADAGSKITATDVEGALQEIETNYDAHIADTTDAHDASATSIADAGGFTSQTEVEAALQEIYQDLITAQAFIAIPNGIVYESDATNATAITNATTPSLDLTNGDTDSAMVFTWGTTNDQDPIIFQVPLPPDIDTTADVVLHFRAKMSGATDTPTIASDTYFNEADTKVEDVSTACGSTWAEETITIAAADVPAGAQTVTIELTPGAHTTDTLYISAFWIEYTRTLNGS